MKIIVTVWIGLIVATVLCIVISELKDSIRRLKIDIHSTDDKRVIVIYILLIILIGIGTGIVLYFVAMIDEPWSWISWEQFSPQYKIKLK